MAAQNFPWYPFTLKSNSNLKTNISLFLPVEFLFSFFFCESLNGGSVSGASMVTSYLLNTERRSLFSTLQSKEWAFKLFRPDSMISINVYVSLISTRIFCRFGRMPEYVISKVLGGAIIMGRREYMTHDDTWQYRTPSTTFSTLFPLVHDVMSWRDSLISTRICPRHMDMMSRWRKKFCFFMMLLQHFAYVICIIQYTLWHAVSNVNVTAVYSEHTVVRDTWYSE